MVRPTNKEAPFFGQCLAKARANANLTQAQLAEKLGLSVKTIDHYERRCPNPTLKFVMRVSKILNVSIVNLLQEDKSKKPGPMSKLDRQLEQIKNMPQAEQKFVTKILDKVLKD